MPVSPTFGYVITKDSTIIESYNLVGNTVEWNYIKCLGNQAVEPRKKVL